MPDQLTVTGLEIDDLETRRAAVVAELRAEISAILDCNPQYPTGQLVDILLERVQAAAELIQSVHSAMDPDQATGQSLDGISSITGTYRNLATEGSVVLTLNLDAVTTVPAGSIAAVTGDPDNEWITVADCTSVGAGDYTVGALSSQTGPVAAPAGTITVIVTPVVGWNTVSNVADATLGDPEETDVALRLRRELEVMLSGSSSVDSIRAAVLEVDQVVEAYVTENDLSVAAGGMPPHSVELVYWDGGGSVANRDDIAECLFSEKPAGIQAFGTPTVAFPDPTVTYTDSQGNTHEIGMTYADEQRIRCNIDITTDATFVAGTVSSAIEDWADANLGIGDDVWRAQMTAIAMGVAGVVNVVSVLLSIFPAAPGGADIAIGTRQIATIAAVDVTEL